MTAVTFPGQGSQRPGMGRELHDRFAVARETFDQVSSATGLDLPKLCFDTPEQELRQTRNAQLALFTCGVAAYRSLCSLTPSWQPEVCAGHSVGEYAALVAAEALSLTDGARLVLRRGELMGTAGEIRPGTMAAVLGMDAADLEIVCRESSTESSVAVIANDNCPGQLVISGDVDAVQRASALAGERGAKRVLPLNVSGAFHSPLMEDSAVQMREALNSVSFHPPKFPVVSNVRATAVTIAEDWPDLLEEQLRHCVRWTESVGAMLSSGIRQFVECGSGEVLTGLLKRIDREATGFAVVDAVTCETAAEMISGVKA